MFGRIHWLDMPEIVYGKPEKVILRVTAGDSEFIDTTDSVYKLVVKKEAWFDPSDSTHILAKVSGELESSKELGRIVFRLGKEQTELNPTKRYFCQIIKQSIANDNDIRVVFAGTFNVIKSNLFKGGVI